MICNEVTLLHVRLSRTTLSYARRTRLQREAAPAAEAISVSDVALPRMLSSRSEVLEDASSDSAGCLQIRVWVLVSGVFG